MMDSKSRISGPISVIALIISTISVAILLLSFKSHSDTATVTQHVDSTCMFNLPAIPDTVYFCGEIVPLNNIDVYESLEKELISNMYFHSQTMQIYLRSGRFFPLIEKILAEYDVPDDLKYIAAAESALTNARSPAGAIGYWQILESTGSEYGLEINKEVDERYHIAKSTEFAAKFLKHSYQKFGNWTMATASYNRGKNGIRKQIERQKDSSYYNLLLNSETARYVYRIIALKLILESPESYGFCMFSHIKHKPHKTKEITINQGVKNFADFAIEHKTNYKVLKILNPWLRENYLTNSRQKEYIILIPKNNSQLKRD